MALTESELSAILEREQRQAIAYLASELSKEREDALKRYYGEPYGNEEDGRSKVVMRDVQDVVEWLLPALVKVFVSGDTVVEFMPIGPEDEDAAKQRTEYINYVFTQDNNGFLVVYAVFKDMLIQKNGVAKVYYDDAAIEDVRTLQDIDDEQLTMLNADPDVEILSQESAAQDVIAGPDAPGLGGAGVMGGPPVPEFAGAMSPPADGVASQAAPMAPAMLHTVKYRKRQGRVKIETIPPEQWLLSSRATDIATAPYVGDRKRKTISELISEGFDPKLLEGVSDGDGAELTGEAYTRSTIHDQGDNMLADREGVMREVWVTDHYILVDFDEDGIAERRRVITAGSTSNILLNEEWEGLPPYASASPILIPHRVIGNSIADQVSDLQLINTTLMRQMLNNLYLTNHPRFAGTDQVNQDDWYAPNPGQLISTGSADPNVALREVNVPFTAGATLPVMEFIASVRENRTGVTRYNQGMDADSLNKTARGITQIMTAAQQRTELMARIVAETFMKDLFRLIDHCVTKYQQRERIVRIRNKWVPVDPRQWESNFDMTINVGLGTGNKDQMLMHLQMIAGMQAQVIQLQGGPNGPMVTWDNIYETAKKLTENAGLRNADTYWTDPKSAPPPPPPPPDPEMVKIQQQGEIDKAKLAQQAQTDQQKLALDKDRVAAETQIKWIEMNANLALKKQDNEAHVQLSSEKQLGDQALARESSQATSDPQIVDMVQQFIARQEQRDAEQSKEIAALRDQQMQLMARLLTANRKVIRGQDGRVSGTALDIGGEA